jgi:ParB family chromosome partitioning protein
MQRAKKMAADGGETAVVEDEEVAEDDSVSFEAHATAAE